MGGYGSTSRTGEGGGEQIDSTWGRSLLGRGCWGGGGERLERRGVAGEGEGEGVEGRGEDWRGQGTTTAEQGTGEGRGGC